MLSLFSRSGRRKGASLIKVVLILAAIGLGICLFLLPMIRTGREPARRNICVNKMKQLALALQNYHDAYRTLPPALTVDDDGKPLHSWRTLILPYVEETTLYQSIDLSKPWDDPTNAKALNTAIDAFQCPSSADAPENHTNYMAILAPDSCLKPGRSRMLSEISDGPQRTIVLVEVPAKKTMPWMAPEDISEEQLLEVLKTGQTNHSGGVFIVAFVDGSVRTMSTDIDRQLLHALTTASGKEDTNLPE